MAGVMMLLTTPMLLCSTSGAPLKSEDGAGTIFENSSKLPVQTGSENHTTARGSTVSSRGQVLSDCQENLETFNPNLNNSYPDQWPTKVAASPCAYQDRIDNLTQSSVIKVPKKTSEEKEPKNTRAMNVSSKPRFHVVEHGAPGMFSEQNAPLTLVESTDNTVNGNLENYMMMTTSKEKASLAGSTLGLGQITSPTKVDDDQDLDLFLTFTCQGRCGKKISFPCSCSATCVIYGTCCDNIAHDCPHIWEEGLTRFDLILTADYICDQNSIYLIISCPSTDKETVEQNEMKPQTSNKEMSREETEIQNQFSSNTDTREQRKQVSGDNSIGEIGLEKTREDSITGRLLAALSAAPITDSDSGLTFINQTVYRCNKMPESNVLHWAILLDYVNTIPTRLEDFVQQQTLNNYHPDFDKEILSDHICMRNIKQTCNRTSDIDEPSGIYVKQCLEGSDSVVFSNNPYQYYRNRFCAYCNEGRHNEYRLYLFNNVPLSSSQFQVLMTLTENTFNLKKMASSFGSFRMPWSQAKCPIQAQSSAEQVLSSGKSDQDSQSHCSVTCGDPNFTLRSDGICKAPHEALLAIADDGLAPLCPEAMESLAQFLVCGLKQEIENLRNADFSAPSVSVVFDSSLNRNLYVVQLHLALPVSSRTFFSQKTSDIGQNVYSVALLAKSFHHYWKSQNICSRREKDKNSELKIFSSSSLIKFGLRRSVNLPQLMEELRGPIVNNQSKTTVCLTKTAYCQRECPTNILNPNDLLCMDDPEHERDSAWVSRFHTLSCFYHLNELKTKAKNRATSLSQGYESLLQYVLSLRFLAVIIFLSI
ncbi:hypothetical protein PoB_000094100 [Plakobranchus ocellatus]|uniref:SMB domain-containing protein n=1 Tax=Plakobranchus ocellatus TaxID=259542 RepID=A0AAV3WWH5_9GAST|nr:hypothetical protein PoB_000094100 [Plakobranchus ocellatus]